MSRVMTLFAPITERSPPSSRPSRSASSTLPCSGQRANARRRASSRWIRMRFQGSELCSYQRHFCHHSQAFRTGGSFSEAAANVSGVGRTLLLYDADCGFCRVCVALVLAWDRRRRLRPVALQSEEAEGLLAQMPEEERMASWHLARPDGEVQSAGAAFPPLLRELPGAA